MEGERERKGDRGGEERGVGEGERGRGRWRGGGRGRGEGEGERERERREMSFHVSGHPSTCMLFYDISGLGKLQASSGP